MLMSFDPLLRFSFFLLSSLFLLLLPLPIASEKTLCERKLAQVPANVFYYQRTESAGGAVQCAARCVEDWEFCRSALLIQEKGKSLCQLYGVSMEHLLPLQLPQLTPAQMDHEQLLPITLIELADPPCSSKGAGMRLAACPQITDPTNPTLLAAQRMMKKTRDPRHGRPFRRVRLPSPPPCSSGASSLSQPISLDFGPAVPKENRWPSSSRRGRQAGPSSHHFGAPIQLDDLTGGGGGASDALERLSTHRMAFSSSDDLTTSDSEIYRFAGREALEPARCRFGKFPSLSTIYADDDPPVRMDRFEMKRVLAAADGQEKARRNHRATAHHFLLGESGRRAKPSKEEWLLPPPVPSSKAAGTSQQQKEPPRTPQQQRMPRLEMLKEISPVLPWPDPDEDFDVPPLPRPLQLGREWRPLQTSTMTNFHAAMHKEKGGGGGAPILPRMLPMAEQPPRSLFDPYFPQQQSGPCSTAIAAARPEQFNLPSALAKSFGIRGILFLQVAVAGSLLYVQVRNAALFLDHPPASCFVKVEIRRSPSNRKRTKYDHRFRAKHTVEVRESSWPEFFDEFQFKVSPVHLKFGDKLGLALHCSNGGGNGHQTAAATSHELLGRMSFSLRKFFRLAKQRQWEEGQGQQQPGTAQPTTTAVQVCEGGFFLLPDRMGQQSHLSQDNIMHRKYYDEIGGSSLSSASSFGSSPYKMMSELERSVPSALGRQPFLRGLNPMATVGQQKQKNPLIPGQQTTTMGQNSQRLGDSSQSSSSQSTGVDCKRRPLPGTFPSATTDTTTSDFTSSGLTSFTGPMLGLAGDSFSSGGAEVGQTMQQQQKTAVQLQVPSRKETTKGTQHTAADHHHHDQPTATANHHQAKAKSQPPEGPPQTTLGSIGHQACTSSSSTFNSLSAADQQMAVRRVASFTHSPTLLNGGQQQFKKRNSVTAGTAMTDKMPRKGTFGPLSKTLHFLKSKLDFSMSASVLCPSKEECRLWQESFEALLNHKFGCILFREFLQVEFSEENLDFWLECEQFKRMKEGKKQTQQRAQHIFDTYIQEFANKEVNLDSETQLKTKAAMERQPMGPDVFNLAQSRIEQLMANDSYPRFLKSEQYLKLLNERETMEKGRGATAMNGSLLRVASAKEGGNNVRHNGRSPSLSPVLHGRWGRRNTCSPAAPATLQIPSIIQE